MGAYVRCSRKKSLVIVFKLNQPYVLYPHGEVQGKYYTLIDLPVDGENIEPSLIFLYSQFQS